MLWCIAITWSEPEDGVAVWGPYESEDAAKAALPNVKPYLVNAFASEEERDETLAEWDESWGEYFTAEQCADMGLEWGGVIPDDVMIDIRPIEACRAKGGVATALPSASHQPPQEDRWIRNQRPERRS